MGSIYKRGRVWYLDVRVKGRRIRRKVGTSKKVAELALKDAEVQIAKERYGFSKNDILLERFFEKFTEYSQINHRTKTSERYLAVIGNFKAFLGNKAAVTFVSDISVEMIDSYKVYRKSSGKGKVLSEDSDSSPKNDGAKSSTVNFELDTLRLIFNLAIKWGYLTENPVVGVSRLKTDDSKRPRFLSLKECRLLLDASSPEMYQIFLTLLHTGMRKAELENLTWDDVDLKKRLIHIRGKTYWQPKTGERSIPINDALLTVLLEVRKRSQETHPDGFVFAVKGSGKSHNLLRNELIKTATKAGIDNLTKVHTLRHTFASHLVMNGVDLPSVQKLMGHSDIKTTMVYAHLAPDHLVKAISSLRF